MGPVHRALGALVVGLLSVSTEVVAAEPLPAPPASGFTPLVFPEVAPARRREVATGPKVDLSSLDGKPITSLTARLDESPWSDTPLARPTLGTDAPRFSSAWARAKLAALLETGYYGDGWIEATEGAQGVSVELVLRPRKIVTSVVVDGTLGGVDREEFLRALDVATDQEVMAGDLTAIRERGLLFFARKGYPSSKLRVATRATDDPKRAILTVSVEAGPARLLERRYFYLTGARPEKVRAILDAYAMATGDRLDAERMSAADGKLREALRRAGYYDARVASDVGLFEGKVSARVRVLTGPLHVIQFEGNDTFDVDALRDALDLSEGDLSPATFVTRVREFYRRRGYFDVEVSSATRMGPTGEVRAIVLRIREGRRVVVHSRVYPCLPIAETRGLADGGPRRAADIAREVESFLDEELPTVDFVRSPSARTVEGVHNSGSLDPKLQRARPVPFDFRPRTVFDPAVMDKALSHVQELYRSEGYLHATVGPLLVTRATCSKDSAPGTCAPLPLPAIPTDQCGTDWRGLPSPVASLPSPLECRPDPARGIECSARIDLLVPVKLGPRVLLLDASFRGAPGFAEQELLRLADIAVGMPVNQSRIEEGRRRIADAYRESGHAFVDVRTSLEYSLDNTRARVVFEVHEGPRVIVSRVEIRGLSDTRESLVRKRIALAVGQPFKQSSVRSTEQMLGNLGLFSSVSVGLLEPTIPEAEKVVVVTLRERSSQFVELRGGYSTGEGARGTFEYGHRNLFGYGVSASFRAQAAYLPEQLILDDEMRDNYATLKGLEEKIARRITASVLVPEVGLGPNVRGQVDLLHVRDLQRDYTLTKWSAFAGASYRHTRPRDPTQASVLPSSVQVQVGVSSEWNDMSLFAYDDIDKYIEEQIATNPDLPSSVIALLRSVPLGKSTVVAPRISVTWDRRDDPTYPRRGTLSVSGVEFVAPVLVEGDQSIGLIVRLTQMLSAYIPLTKRITLAGQLKVGYNVRVTRGTNTYPDRLFFLGGVDSMRGWALSSFVPQEYASQVSAGTLPLDKVPLRGGNFMLNPRIELRFPLTKSLESVAFADFGNLWVEPSNVYDTRFVLRADAGTGLRIQTPVGPIALDYGINVTRRRELGEDFGALNFSIGVF